MITTHPLKQQLIDRRNERLKLKSRLIAENEEVIRGLVYEALIEMPVDTYEGLMDLMSRQDCEDLIMAVAMDDDALTHLLEGYWS